MFGGCGRHWAASSPESTFAATWVGPPQYDTVARQELNRQDDFRRNDVILNSYSVEWSNYQKAVINK